MKRKKVVKLRGSSTHGYGSKKKHRGAGSRGGRGFAGSKKQKKTWIIRHKRDHIGKYGFKSLRTRKLKASPRTINIKDLPPGNEIDLAQLGYDKLLGRGVIQRPVTVKAAAFSKKAREKIEKAQGQAITV